LVIRVTGESRILEIWHGIVSTFEFLSRKAVAWLERRNHGIGMWRLAN
jgi:hypothetical protein